MRRAARIAAGLRWAATAFYLVAVAHGIALHHGTDRSARRWTAIYLGAMLGGFLGGRRRDGDPRSAAVLTALLALEYPVIRLLAATPDRPRSDSRHLVGAGIELAALALAHGLVYGFTPIVRSGNKTQ